MTDQPHDGLSSMGLSLSPVLKAPIGYRAQGLCVQINVPVFQSFWRSKVSDTTRLTARKKRLRTLLLALLFPHTPEQGTFQATYNFGSELSTRGNAVSFGVYSNGALAMLPAPADEVVSSGSAYSCAVGDRDPLEWLDKFMHTVLFGAASLDRGVACETHARVD